jgi:hypothetical protein
LWEKGGEATMRRNNLTWATGGILDCTPSLVPV